MSEEQWKVCGKEELELLIAHHGHEHTYQWREDREDHQTTTQPLISAEPTRPERALVKKVVKAQYYPRDSMWKLWALVTKYYLEDFPNLTILAQPAPTLAVHTVQLTPNKAFLLKTTNFIGDPLSFSGIHFNDHPWVPGTHYIENLSTSLISYTKTTLCVVFCVCT